MKKQSLLSVIATSLLLLSVFAPMALTTGPTQPPVVTNTLYVGRAGWGPRNADPVRANDKYSQELIFNVYETLIKFGEPVTNEWGTWDVHEQYWEFSPLLATSVPDRVEVTQDFVNLAYLDLADPTGTLVQTVPPTTTKEFEIVGFKNNNSTDDVLGQCDVLYIMEYDATTHDIITCRTWHCTGITIAGETVTMHLHRFYYDFNIRTDPVVYFVDEADDIVDVFNITDVEYSLERGLVQDQYGSLMWKFYNPLFDQMNSDWWDIGDPAGAWYLAYLIEDAIEIVSSDPPILRINCGIDFPDVAFKQIMCGTWASIVSKEFSISISCWNGDLFSDVDPANGYPDWWDNWRHIYVSPYDAGWRYVGTGPYRVTVVSYVNSLVILERNTHYWGGWPAPERKGYLDRIDIEYIADWATRRDAFMACQLDVCAVPRAFMMELLDPNDLARMRVGWGIPFVAHPEIITIKNIAPVLSLDAVMFTFAVDPYSLYIGTGNLEGGAGIPPNFFNYTGVRNAFAYAFNRTKYLQQAWMGEAICRETPLILGLVPDYYSKGPDPPYKFDENYAKAQIALQSAIMNATGGSEGYLASVWNWGFTLTMTYPSGNDQARIACNMIRDFFLNMSSDPSRAGMPPFTIHIVEEDSPTFLADMESSILPLFVTGWHADFSDADDFERAFMHSQGYFSCIQNYTRQNGWTTPGPRTGLDKDQLIDLAVKTPDGPQRADMYADLDDIYLTDCPSLPIAEPRVRRWQKYWVKGWYYNALYPSDYYYHLYKEDAPWADVTGPMIGVPDGIVTNLDMGYVAAHYGAKAPDPTNPTEPYDPRWAPGTYGCGGADVYGDRKIDMGDITFEAAQFGKGVCPPELEHGGNVYLNATPTKQIVGIGYNIFVTVKVTNVVDLTGYQICLLYNASLLELVGSNIEPLLGWDTTINGTIGKTCDGQNCRIVDCLKMPSSGSPFSGDATLVTFVFKGLAKGNATLSISRSTLATGRQRILYNPVNGTVSVGVPCDVTGLIPGVPDGICNMRDIGFICSYFLASPEDPRWELAECRNCDIIDDGIVNMRDIGEACANYLKEDP